MINYKFTRSNDKGIGLTLTVNTGGGFNTYTYTVENHKALFELIDAVRQYSKAYSEGEDTSSLEENVIKFIKPEYMRIAVQDIPKLTMKNGSIFYEDEALHGVLVDEILNFKSMGLPFDPYWNFLERLLQNPDRRSKEQLYQFIEKNNFPPIDMDGYLIAYKGLNEDWTSIHSGYGIVNGVEIENGNLDNSVGNVIEMPRDMVDADPNSPCSYGLHVGSLEYVKSFAKGKIVLVKVDPKDVVSVPYDSNCQKIRCCKYEVIGEFEDEITDKIFTQGVKEFGENFESLKNVDCEISEDEILDYDQLLEEDESHEDYFENKEFYDNYETDPVSFVESGEFVVSSGKPKVLGLSQEVLIRKPIEEVSEVTEGTDDTDLEKTKNSMIEMLDDTIENEFHLANRAVKRLFPDLTGLERKEVFEKLVPIAKEVLDIEDNGYEEEELDLETVLDQQDIGIILDNADTIFPARSHSDLADKLMDLWNGKGNWDRNTQAYYVELGIAADIYDTLGAPSYYSEITEKEFKAHFLR